MKELVSFVESKLSSLKSCFSIIDGLLNLPHSIKNRGRERERDSGSLRWYIILWFKIQHTKFVEYFFYGSLMRAAIH